MTVAIKCCPKGHPKNEANVWWSVRGDGQRVGRCRVCNKNAKRAKRELITGGVGMGAREDRRWINYSCGHSVIFSPPLPRGSEDVWCFKCDDVAKVLRWGSEAPKVVVHAEEASDEG